MVFFELRDRLSRYFGFTWKEIRDLFTAIIVTGFVFSFKEWGVGSVLDVALGLHNLVLITLLVALSFFVHEALHRIYALSLGFKSEFKLWWGGLAISVIFAFITNGAVQLVLPGGMVLALLMRHRLGEFRYGMNYWENGITAMLGPLANLALAFIAKAMLISFPGNFIFEKLLIINIMFAICTMLPIPPLDGINTFFAGRILYIITFAGVVAGGILIYFTSLWIALIGGILLTILATVLFYLLFEQPVGGGGGH